MTEVHVTICKLIYAYFTTEIILKQLFTSVSVILGEYLPRRFTSRKGVCKVLGVCKGNTPKLRV